MANAESKLWEVKVYNDTMAAITQKASGTTRYVHPSRIPWDTLAAVSEQRFDAILRDLFHKAAQR